MKAPRLTRSLAPIRRLGLVALALSAIGSPSFADSTVEPVVWTELVGASAVGSTLAKTGSSGSWDAGGVSTKGIVSVDGYVEFVGEETGTSRMVGLSWGQTDAGYVDIDYALYLAGGSLQIYEGGVYRGSFGSWTRGDLFRVGVESGQVVYRRNGVELYRSLVAPRYPLLVDASLMNRGATARSAGPPSQDENGIPRPGSTPTEPDTTTRGSGGSSPGIP